MDFTQVKNGCIAAAQQSLPPEYISGWYAGHRAQAGKLVVAAARATENISSGRPVQEQFDLLCWAIYNEWQRESQGG